MQIREALTAGHRVERLLAAAIYEFDEDSSWAWLGGCETLEEYLAGPGRDATQPAVPLQADVVGAGGQALVAPARLEELEPSKVAEVLPAIVGGKIDTDVALSDVAVLGKRDLRERYKGKPDTSSKLDATKEPQRCKCPACGTWVDLDQIDQSVIDGTAKEITDNGARA